MSDRASTGDHVDGACVPGYCHDPKTGKVDVVDQYGYSHGKRANISDMDLRFAGADAVAAAGCCAAVGKRLSSGQLPC